jgi:Zn-dependent peptidase ImmA (M78 family)
MNKLNKLFKLCDAEGIKIEFATLPYDLLGLYFEEKDYPPVISLHKCLEKNNLKLLEVLGEELGHHYTTCGNHLGPYPIYRNRIILNKVEEKAMRWATNYLISKDELLSALNKNITSLYDLADELGVSYSLLEYRLEFLSREECFISFNDNALFLELQPNIHSDCINNKFYY